LLKCRFWTVGCGEHVDYVGWHKLRQHVCGARYCCSTLSRCSFRPGKPNGFRYLHHYDYFHHHNHNPVR
jgi:hypothetical protein